MADNSEAKNNTQIGIDTKEEGSQLIPNQDAFDSSKMVQIELPEDKTDNVATEKVPAATDSLQLPG